MERSARWSVLLAVIGSVLATTATFLHYIHAHSAGEPGGYAPMLFGSLAVGLLAALCRYLTTPKPLRSALSAVSSGVFAAVAFAVVLAVTLTWSFGS